MEDLKMDKNTSLVLSYNVVQDLKNKHINISKICRLFLQEFNEKFEPEAKTNTITIVLKKGVIKKA